MATMIGAAYLELTARNQQLKAKLKESGVMSEKTVNAMQSRWQKFGKAAFVGAIAGLAALTAAMTKATAAAAAEELQTVQLRHQMRRLGADTEANAARVEAAAAELQKFTRFGDTQTRKTLQDLMTLSNDFEGSMKNLELVFDIAESGMFDVNTAARYVGQAMTGNVEILGRYIPELKTSNNEQLKTMTSAEKAAFALELLRGKFGGLARMVGETTAGAWAKLTNAISDLWEALGKGMLDTTNKNLVSLTDTLKSVEKDAETAGAALATMFDVGIKGAAGFVRMVEGAADTLQRWFAPQRYRERRLAELAALDAKLVEQQAKQRADAAKAEAEWEAKSEEMRVQALREYEQYLKDKEEARLKYEARQLRAAGYMRAAEVAELEAQHRKEIESFKGSREMLKKLEETHQMEMRSLRDRFAEEDARKRRQEFIEQAKKSHEEFIKRIRRIIGEKYGTKFSEVPADLQKYLLPETDEALQKWRSTTDQFEEIYKQFLRNIGLAREADIRDAQKYWSELEQRFKDNAKMLTLIEAARAADMKRIEEEHREEVKKTQKEVFKPQWVGAQELWKRAATLGRAEPEVKVEVKRMPTKEEQEQLKVLREILVENKLQKLALQDYGKLK